MMGRYAIACRLCGATPGGLGSVQAAAGWYLLHVIDDHWEIMEALRLATLQTRAAALAVAAGEGWLDDAGKGADGGE